MSTTEPSRAGEGGYTFGYSPSTLSSHASRTARSDAAFLLPYIQPHHYILDVGCGPGTITASFAPLVPHGRVVGVDLTPEIVQRAEQLLGTRARTDTEAETETLPVTNIAFTQGNVLERLPFADDAFDVVYSSQLLPHLPARDQGVRALTEMRRVLKPGGLLAARAGAASHFWPYTRDLKRLFYDNMFRGVGYPSPHPAAGGSEPGADAGADDLLVGPKLGSYLRAAGFDVDDPKRVRITGGATVHADKASVQWWADGLCGRLGKGDPFRESWVKAGVSEEEIEQCVVTLKAWAGSEDAWYGCLQSEILAWK